LSKYASSYVPSTCTAVIVRRMPRVPVGTSTEALFWTNLRSRSLSSGVTGPISRLPRIAPEAPTNSARTVPGSVWLR